MGTGKPRISTAAQLVGRVAGRRALERLLGQVAVPELEPVLVQAELERGQVAVPERELGQAVEPETSELETAQVAARELVTGLAAALELERDPVVALALALDQVVVALRIRLVTAAHPHDLVPLLAAAKDLAAAAAETTPEPAAAEAVIAWEVAE
jgi:hypothetical protein